MSGLREKEHHAGHGPKRLRIAIAAIAVFLALPARSESPGEVIPLVPGEEEFLPPSRRMADLLKLERREVWRYYPSEDFAGIGTRLEYWCPCTIPPLRAGNILVVAAWGGGRMANQPDSRSRCVFCGLDLATGRLLWEVTVEGIYVEARVRGDIVYFSQPDTLFRKGQVLSAHDLSTGKQLWAAPDAGYVLQGFLDGGVIVDQYPEPVVALLDGRTGKETWRFPVQPLGVKVDRGRLFVAGSRKDGSVLARLDPATGHPLWERKIERADLSLTSRTGEAYGTRRFNWDIDADRLYTIVGKKVAAFDTATGNEVWRKNYDDEQRSALLAANGMVYTVYGWNWAFGGVPGGSGPWINYWKERLYAIDGSTGKAVWSFGRSIHDEFIVSKGRVLVLNNTHSPRTSYYLLDARTGKRLSEYKGLETFFDRNRVKAEFDANDAYRVLNYRWILRGPDGKVWLLSLSPVPPRYDQLRNHALLMEAFEPTRTGVE